LSVAPGSPVGNAGYRVLMGAAAISLTRARGRAAQAVRSALLATARGRTSAAERVWLDRIAAGREELRAGALAEIAPPDDRGLSAEERREEASAAHLWMSLPPLIGTLLMRLVRELRPASCLELGTGFGLSTSFQAAGLELNGAGRITSLDVDGMQSMARASLNGLGLGDRVELIGGQIEDTLPGALDAAAPIDYALLDADHTHGPTVAAFEALLPRLPAEAVLVFDDVNWTDGMRAAWRDVRDNPRVTHAVTIRRLGIAVVAGTP
jgi:predicted O-methyltransferase YrrM